MKRDDAEEFTQSLGQIIGGSYRQVRLAHLMGVPRALGFKDTRAWVEDRLGGYIKMSAGERSAAAQELIEEGLTQREAADILGTSPATVNRAVSNETGDELDAPSEEADVSNETKHNHRAQGTGENEWYTPPKYIEMARKVLGEIDLDPATSKKAQQTVKAKHFFTVDDDGLKHEWRGRVWLNPPYAQPAIGNFVSKMVSERNSGRIDAGIMLTHNYTDTAWFYEAASLANAICFTRGRIKFIAPDGNDCSPTQGQAFFYYGDRTHEFTKHFSAFGFVLVPGSRS